MSLSGLKQNSCSNLAAILPQLHRDGPKTACSVLPSSSALPRFVSFHVLRQSFERTPIAAAMPPPLAASFFPSFCVFLGRRRRRRRLATFFVKSGLLSWEQRAMLAGDRGGKEHLNPPYMTSMAIWQDLQNLCF